MTKMISTDKVTSDVKVLSDADLNEVAGGETIGQALANINAYLHPGRVETIGEAVSGITAYLRQRVNIISAIGHLFR
jgi:hypothetical protein